MSPSTSLFAVLFLAVCLTAMAAVQQQPRVHPVIHNPDKNSVGNLNSLLNDGAAEADATAKACEKSFDKAFCQAVLKNRANSEKSSMKELAFVAIEAASKEAISTAEFIKGTVENEQSDEAVDDSNEEQTMTDCAEEYTSIVELIQEAMDALLTRPNDNTVETQLKAAITTADTCQSSIVNKTGKAVVLARKNLNVKQLCTNALSVYQVYITSQS